MIDSKQDEAVKLEACPFCGCDEEGRVGFERPNGGTGLPYVICLSCLGKGPEGDSEEDAAELWNTRTPPANLNAPDKQEALAGPTDFEVTKAALAILAADKDDLLAGDGYPKEAAEAFARAALMAAAPALAGDDRNGVGGLLEQMWRAVSPIPDRHGGISPGLFKDVVRPILAEALSRTPSSPQADVERVARAISPDIGWDNPDQGWMSAARERARQQALQAIAALAPPPQAQVE